MHINNNNNIYKNNKKRGQNETKNKTENFNGTS